MEERESRKGERRGESAGRGREGERGLVSILISKNGTTPTWGEHSLAPGE